MQASVRHADARESDFAVGRHVELDAAVARRSVEDHALGGAQALAPKLAMELAVLIEVDFSIRPVGLLGQPLGANGNGGAVGAEGDSHARGSAEAHPGVGG